MSLNIERRKWISDRLPGAVFLAISLYLMFVYAEGQLQHTFRFVVEALDHINRIEAAEADSTAKSDSISEDDSMVKHILESDTRFAKVMADPARYRLQVILGLIEEGTDGRKQLVQHTYRSEAEYFYPASTIKLCAAVAALEELEALRLATGLALDENTPLTYHPLFDDEELESSDASNTEGGPITVQHEVRKIFLVSDNVAFNRMYELVGPARLNESMLRAGLASTRLVHRLSEFRTAEENRRSPRIDFVGKGFLHEIPRRVDELDLPVASLSGYDVGRGYMQGGELVEQAMDFRVKNRMSLSDLQRGLAKVVRPDVDAGGPGFRLSAGDRELLLKAMAQLPRESANPVYDPASYPDDWVKLLLPGIRRVMPLEKGQDRVRIYNKVGQAYGFTTENSYVVDTATGRGFFLAATIYTNEDGVLGNDQYEYSEVALPFMADLGEAVVRSLWP